MQPNRRNPVEMVDDKPVDIMENFYSVIYRQSRLFDKDKKGNRILRYPKNMQKAAVTITEQDGAKVRAGLIKGKWAIQAVLIPRKKGMTKRNAVKLADEVVSRLTRSNAPRLRMNPNFGKPDEWQDDVDWDSEPSAPSDWGQEVEWDDVESNPKVRRATAGGQADRILPEWLSQAKVVNAWDAKWGSKGYEMEYMGETFQLVDTGLNEQTYHPGGAYRRVDISLRKGKKIMRDLEDRSLFFDHPYSFTDWEGIEGVASFRSAWDIPPGLKTEWDSEYRQMDLTGADSPSTKKGEEAGVLRNHAGLLNKKQQIVKENSWFSYSLKLTGLSGLLDQLDNELNELLTKKGDVLSKPALEKALPSWKIDYWDTGAVATKKFRFDNEADFRTFSALMIDNNNIGKVRYWVDGQNMTIEATIGSPDGFNDTDLDLAEYLQSKYIAARRNPKVRRAAPGSNPWWDDYDWTIIYPDKYTKAPEHLEGVPKEEGIIDKVIFEPRSDNYNGRFKAFSIRLPFGGSQQRHQLNWHWNDAKYGPRWQLTFEGSDFSRGKVNSEFFAKAEKIISALDIGDYETIREATTFGWAPTWGPRPKTHPGLARNPAYDINGPALKKQKCCCGATAETPCLCMLQGHMDCSAKEPMCPCYAEIAMGTEIEMEHTDDPAEAKRIAMEHLSEHPDYYTRMQAAGLARNPKVRRAAAPLEQGNDRVFVYSYGSYKEQGHEVIFGIKNLQAWMKRIAESDKWDIAELVDSYEDELKAYGSFARYPDWQTDPQQYFGMVDDIQHEMLGGDAFAEIRMLNEKITGRGLFITYEGEIGSLKDDFKYDWDDTRIAWFQDAYLGTPSTELFRNPKVRRTSAPADKVVKWPFPGGEPKWKPSTAQAGKVFALFNYKKEEIRIEITQRMWSINGLKNWTLTKTNDFMKTLATILPEDIQVEYIVDERTTPYQAYCKTGWNSSNAWLDEMIYKPEMKNNPKVTGIRILGPEMSNAWLARWVKEGPMSVSRLYDMWKMKELEL